MTPGAILAAALEVAEGIEARPAPLDAALARYQRNRRYIGSKDRAALGERLFGMARRRARLEWRLRDAGAEPTPRRRLLADLRLTDGLTVEHIAQVLEAGRYGPEPLAPEEGALLFGMRSPLETPEMPEPVRLECPDWAWDGFEKAFPDPEDRGAELRALTEQAPLDLRANLLKTEREAALWEIRAAGFEAEPTPHAPTGIRLPQRVALGRLPGLKEGKIEPQDEGSQLLALALGAEPGETIADFCAGAGGKSLAIAGRMANKGQLYALDIDGRRLEEAAKRAAKAGVDIMRRHTLERTGDRWLKRNRGRFDRVLIDAPCSGVGAWRRNPDARWSRGQPPLSDLRRWQSEILARASTLVRPGGLLVYATCSMLPAENDDQVEAFLGAHEGFRRDPPPDFPVPLTAGDLKITPANHGTDGVFVAWLRRS